MTSIRFFDLISVKLTFCLILGIGISFHFEPRTSMVVALLALSLVFLTWTWKTQKRSTFPLFGTVALLATVILGMLVTSFSLPKNLPNHYLNFPKAKSKLQLKVTQVLKPNSYSYRYFAKVKTIDTSMTSGLVLLYIAKDSTAKELAVDDELLTYSLLDSVPPPLNPHQFDFKRYLRQQGVYGQLRLSGNQFVILKNPLKTWVGIAANFRAGLIGKLQKQGFGSEQLGVIQALLLGQRNNISEATYTTYKNAGAVHILAVSGLHIGILLLLLQFLLQPLNQLPKGKTIKGITIVVLLWGYAFIAGLSPSIVRAVTMFSFLAYALHLNRPTNTFNILALSMFFILLVRPLFLFQVGFQMSYAAVFAIVWLYPKLQRFWYPKTWIIQKGWQLLSVSIAAQLGVLPISLFYFHQFPALFFVSNLIIVPFLGILLGLGLLVLGLTHFCILPKFLVTLYDGLIGKMNGIIAWVAQQETFLFSDIAFDEIQLVLGYVVILGLIVAISKLHFNSLAFLFIALVFYSGYLVTISWLTRNEEQLWVFHQTKNSVLVHQKGAKLGVLAYHPHQAEKEIRAYKTAQRILSETYDSLKNHYALNTKKILVVDSTGIYGSIKNPDYVLLTQSPKINLERFLDSVQPKKILADGSNYRSYINRWKQTCSKRKLYFHYTGEMGAYNFE
ncbi:MAG: ComEC/Rec2 family competence protein [Bacteroidota bacterium]